MLRGVARQTCAAWDDEGYALLVAVHGFIPQKGLDPYFILGLVNSTFCNWLHRVRFYSARIPKGSLRYPISFWEKVPVPLNDPERMGQIASLAKSIVELDGDEAACHEELDLAVYDLFGVDEGELSRHYPVPKA